jgi:hypothetical protein
LKPHPLIWSISSCRVGTGEQKNPHCCLFPDLNFRDFPDLDPEAMGLSNVILVNAHQQTPEDTEKSMKAAIMSTFIGMKLDQGLMAEWDIDTALSCTGLVINYIGCPILWSSKRLMMEVTLQLTNIAVLHTEICRRRAR